MRTTYGLVAAIVLPAAHPPQGAPQRHLGRPTATVEHALTGIDGVRELRDGRVIVLDAQDKTIHVFDLKTGIDTPIGRNGDGPGEFRLPLDIWPVGGDSSVIRDMARFGKVMAITTKPRIGGFVSMLDSAFSTRSFNPAGADTAGRLYGLEYTVNFVMDSARIVRWDVAHHRRDTLALYMAAIEPRKIDDKNVVRGAGGRVIGVRAAERVRPFRPQNQWAVAADGRIAIVGASPYRVTFVNPNGTRTVGEPVRYVPVPVAEAEKAAWRADAARPRPSIMRERGGGMVATFTPGRVPTDVDWPDVYPPFLAKAPWFASDGMLWVKRATPAGAPDRYDVFDQAAQLEFQVDLPTRREVVGFGRGVVFLARVDEDDLHYLERYALPAARPTRP